jgi:hypothetical protein
VFDVVLFRSLGLSVFLKKTFLKLDIHFFFLKVFFGLFRTAKYFDY